MSTRDDRPHAPNALREGALGPAAVAFFVVSAAGPLVAMAGGVPVAMLFGNGPGIPAMFLAAMIVLCCFAAGYTLMAREIRNAGAFYAFAAHGLGGHAAGATGAIALLSYNAIQLGLYGLFGTAAGGLLNPLLGVALPWWAYSLAAMASIAFFGYRQVDLSAKVLGVLVALEYLVVLALDGGIVAAGGHEGLSLAPFFPDQVGAGSPWIGLMLCFAAFIGFEATTIYSEEARDPERTIPMATYASVLLIGGFYTFSTWATVNGAGIGQLLPTLTAYPDPTQLLFDLSDRYVGPGLSTAMSILFVTSVYASLLAFHNAIARYLYAMGREGLLSSALGRTHSRFQSPHVGSLVQSAGALVIVLLFVIGGADPVLTVFTLLSAVATLGIIILMATTSAAILVFFRHRKDMLFRSHILPAASLAAFIAIALLACFHFDAMAGTNSAVVPYLPLLIPAAGAVGLTLAGRLRKRRPEGFSRLGASTI